MRLVLATTALMLSLAGHAGAQTHDCADAVTCNNGSINKADTTATQTIGDHVDNTYAPDSASASSASSANVGDVIAQGGTGGNASATGANLNNASAATAAGGSVAGSGNSTNDNRNTLGQGQQQGQDQRQNARASNRSNTTVGGQRTSVDARDQSKTEYEAAAGSAMVSDAWSTAPCAKVASLSAQTVGAGAALRIDRESGNCWAERRATQIALLADRETALLYLAQQDPALWATLVAQGRIEGAPRRAGDTNRLMQAQMPKARLVSSQAAQVCQLKPGTSRTVVTNWPDRMTCARTLGLAGEGGR